MHLTQLRRPLQRVAVSSSRQFAPSVQTLSLVERFAQLRVDVIAANAAVHGRRHASVKSQGAYKLTNKKTIPKKMGAKKTGDQYVIPGNILYKQRGTIWHAGEGTIIGRSHTIHAAIPGYVKYYRDPLRHPKRQYIGVVYDKDDILPRPVGAPRKRKLGLVAIPRREQLVMEEAVGPSGIPLTVTRHEEVEVPADVAKPNTVTTTKKSTKPSAAKPVEPENVVFKDGNSVIAALIKEQIKSRTEHNVKKEALRLQQEEELRVRKGTRVLRLQKDYSYRETNWEIGRLVGDAGTVAGTEKLESRKGKFRLRKKKRAATYGAVKRRSLEKLARRVQYREFVWKKRVQMAAARATVAAAQAERKVVKDAAKDSGNSKVEG